MVGKDRLVYGVGINDADYALVKKGKVDGKWKTVWECPYYRKWCQMLSRCYSKNIQERQPTYKGCTVWEEWLTFSNFKKWMEQQEWEGRALDKDFLVEGNKVYGPTTCVFIPNNLNSFIVTGAKARGEYPLGVSYAKKPKYMVNERSKPYRSMIRNQTGKKVSLGEYLTPKEAHQAYLVAKLEQCKSYLMEFKNETLTVKALIRIRDKIQYHLDNNLELTSY